jgi:uncharacterized protein GlcG (DUF336 family)
MLTKQSRRSAEARPTVIGEAATRLRLPGGLPIIRAGQLAGALGVAGVSDDQAVECARARIDALEEKGDL